MRTLAILLATLALVACSTAPVARSRSHAASPGRAAAPEPPGASPEPPLEFLLTSAAADFHTHRPPDPIRFRNVRLGHAPTPENGTQYMLCGQFLPAQDQGDAEWTPFVTIETSGYEQWLGSQAAGFCQRPSVVWDTQEDLSASLQSKLDSLR
jgi:hypothetical protein